MQNLTSSRLLLAVIGIFTFCISSLSQAQSYGGFPQGMSPFYGYGQAQPQFQPMYGYNGGATSFAGPAPFIGESASNSASIINCRCAALIMEGKENEDLSCANFKTLYQRQVMSAGSTGVINAPAQTPGHR
jgi:hypothetical protein